MEYCKTNGSEHDNDLVYLCVYKYKEIYIYIYIYIYMLFFIIVIIIRTIVCGCFLLTMSFYLLYQHLMKLQLNEKK